MGRINNLQNSQLPGVVQDLRSLGTAAPMNNAAIGRGGIEVYDGGTINVSSGNLIVNGTATISGVLNADGTVTLSGTVAISGPLTVTGMTTISGNTDITGDLDVDGPMTTTGTLSVEGVTTLKNDLNVTTGKVKVGSALTIDPAVDGGGLSFGSGAKLANYAGGIALQSGSAVLGLTSAGASIGTAAANIITSQDSGLVQVTGQLRVASLPSSSQSANVYADANGNLYRSTAP